jgi:hypothetical protein
MRRAAKAAEQVRQLAGNAINDLWHTCQDITSLSHEAIFSNVVESLMLAAADRLPEQEAIERVLVIMRTCDKFDEVKAALEADDALFTEMANLCERFEQSEGRPPTDDLEIKNWSIARGDPWDAKWDQP